MERKDVKWEEIREKERELFTLEEQYYQEKKKLDNKALVLRKFSSTADDVRDYFIEIENLRHFSNQVYRDHRIKLEDEREKYDNEFRKKRNDLDEEFHKLRRDYASTNE